MNKFICSECGTKYSSPEQTPPPGIKWNDGHICTPTLVKSKLNSKLMKNSIILIIVVGIITTCFLIELHSREINYEQQLELKNDTIFNLRVDIANHKNLFNDLVQLTDSDCFQQINRINLHFGRSIKLNAKTK